MAVRIGITCDYEVLTDRRGQVAPRYQLQQFYVDAIVAAGGEPWLLPHVLPETASSVLEVIQGLVISGGDFDVPPTYYGETPRAKLGKLCEPRTAFERALLVGARERGTPVLGICGGMQLINVVFGGSLYQDLSERPGTAEHIQPHTKQKPFHRVEVAPGSLLGRLVGANAIEVNSTHHQVVRQLGSGLVASGIAPDGVIEALETPEGFILGVEWHPEAMGSQEQLAIYRGLVEAAGGYSG